MSEDGWVEVAHVDDLPPNSGLETRVEIGGDTVGVFMVDNQYFAVGECTHERGPIAQGRLEGFHVVCPWHSAKFDIRDGSCLNGPVACRVDGQVALGDVQEIEKSPALKRFEVKVDGSRIFARSYVETRNAMVHP